MTHRLGACDGVAALHPVFVASLAASVLVHAFVLGTLPPLTEVLPWRAARALDVTLESAKPPPALPMAEVAPVPAAPKRTVRKDRAAPVASAVPLREQAVTPPNGPVRVESAARETRDTAPVLAQDDAQRSAMTVVPAGGADAPGVARPAQREAVASIKPAEPAVPPNYRASYLRNPSPHYPLAARLGGEQGTVVLNVLVTQQGLPGSVTIEKTSGFPLLDAAALQTVRQWRFVPARKGEQAIDDSVRVPIRFRLEDG